MIRNYLLPVILSLPLAFGACTTDKKPEQNDSAEPAKQDGKVAKPAEPAKVAKPVVHDVKCGCSIDGVGSCGNYIMIDGKYVPMIHPKLGKMEWCAQKAKGAKVETIGEMKDGKFVAESWKTIQ